MKWILQPFNLFFTSKLGCEDKQFLCLGTYFCADNTCIDEFDCGAGPGGTEKGFQQCTGLEPCNMSYFCGQGINPTYLF